MVHQITPEYLSKLVPPTIGETHNYGTRNSKNLTSILCKTNFYMNSFLPSAVSSWNQLPLNIGQNQSITNLKSHLNPKSLNKPPRYYSTGTRLGQIYHTRPRLGCCSLHQDLYRKHIVPSPLCTCGQIENTIHYFLECPITST